MYLFIYTHIYLSIYLFDDWLTDWLRELQIDWCNNLCTLIKIQLSCSLLLTFWQPLLPSSERLSARCHYGGQLHSVMWELTREAPVNPQQQSKTSRQSQTTPPLWTTLYTGTTPRWSKRQKQDGPTDQKSDTHQERTRQVDERRRKVLPTSTHLRLFTVRRSDTWRTVVPTKAAAVTETSI